VLFLY